MNTQDVNKWLIVDGLEFNMNDDKIVQSVLHDFNNTPSLQETEELEENISLNRDYSALQISPT